MKTRVHVKSATGLACDGRECVTSAEVNDVIALGTRARAMAAKGLGPCGEVLDVDVVLDAQAIEALLAMGITIVGAMQRATRPMTIEDAAELLAWDVGVARRGHAMLEADLSGFLVVEDVTAEGWTPEGVPNGTRADGSPAAPVRRAEWLRLEAAYIAAGIVDEVTGEMRPEFCVKG